MSRQTLFVCMVGFKVGRSVSMVTGIIFKLIRDASIFGLPFVLRVGDILTAFDLMKHDQICSALAKKGIGATGGRMEMRELSDVSLTLQLPGAPLSSAVPLEKAGIQGGVRTPDQFNAMIEHALYKLAQIWQERRWGIELDNGFRLTHLVWCDNIFLFETDLARAEKMMIVLTQVLSMCGLFWKPSSLQVLCAGRLADSMPKIVVEILEGPRQLVVLQVGN